MLLEDRPSFWVGEGFKVWQLGRQAARVLEIIEVMKHWEEGDEREVMEAIKPREPLPRWSAGCGAAVGADAGPYCAVVI